MQLFSLLTNMEEDMSKQAAISEVIEKFWETVPSSWRRTREVIRGAAAEKFHLTVEQFQVLRRIRRGIASVSAIAADSRTSRSAVSKAVDGLVHKGLISRRQDPADRRNIPLSLTGEGERVLTGIYAEAEGWLAERFNCLTAGELDSLLHAMDLLQKTFLDD
jgi:DNA-binding MarR family transcriptional regulator